MSWKLSCNTITAHRDTTQEIEKRMEIAWLSQSILLMCQWQHKCTVNPEVFRMFFNNLAAARHMIGRPLSPWRHCRCIIFLTCAETMEPGLVSITKLDSRRLMRPQSCVWMCVVSPRGDTDPAEILLRWPTKAKFLREMSFRNFCTGTKKKERQTRAKPSLNSSNQWTNLTDLLLKWLISHFKILKRSYI